MKSIVTCAGAGRAPWKAGNWGRLPSPLGLWAAWGWEKDQGILEMSLIGLNNVNAILVKD